MREDGLYYAILKGSVKCEFLLFQKGKIICVRFRDLEASEDIDESESEGYESPVSTVRPLKITSDPKVLSEAFRIAVDCESPQSVTWYPEKWDDDKPNHLAWDDGEIPRTASLSDEGTLLVDSGKGPVEYVFYPKIPATECPLESFLR